jgi:exopolysaccharide biosynthesis protein
MRTFYLGLISFIVLFLLPDTVQALVEKTETVQISSGKKTVKYISFHPSEDYALRPVLAGNKAGLTSELSEMVEEHQAVAAINGTFFNAYDVNDLQPMGAVMIDRESIHIRGGAVAMGITGNGKELVFSTENKILINGGINGSRQWPDRWSAWFMNHLPSSDKEVVLFTPEFRSSKVHIPEFNMVVVDQGKVVSIVQSHAEIPKKGFLIAYGPVPEDKIHFDKFKIGDTVEYWVEYPEELTNALHLISVGPKLITKGQIDVDFARDKMSDPKITKESGQRSFIGYKKDGTIAMGTVSGSTILELAEVLKQLGLYEAMNLDGGASSGLYSNGRYLTQPGRKLSNSLVVVKQKKAPRVFMNETEIFFKDAAPFIEDGTTMVPVRGVFEELGAAVEWDGTTGTVNAKRFDAHIQLTVGKIEATVNGEIKSLPKAPVNIKGRVYIPLRFVSEALGARVGWEQSTNSISIDFDILTARFHYDAGAALAP